MCLYYGRDEMGIRLMTYKPRLHTKSWAVSFCSSKGKEIKPWKTAFPVGIFNPVKVQPERHCIKCTIGCVSRRRTKREAGRIEMRSRNAPNTAQKGFFLLTAQLEHRCFCGCGDYSIRCGHLATFRYRNRITFPYAKLNQLHATMQVLVFVRKEISNMNQNRLKRAISPT
jgi:hypothetical protein